MAEKPSGYVIHSLPNVGYSKYENMLEDSLEDGRDRANPKLSRVQPTSVRGDELSFWSPPVANVD